MQVPSRRARRRRGATMQDVANLSSVSKQTVSAVINGKPGITEETQVRVLAVIEQTNYRMDLTARSLHTARTYTVSLLVTNISSPVPGAMASAAEERLYAENYSLLLYSTHDDVEMLLAQLDGTAPEPARLQITPALIVRESTAAPKRE